jgi:hypothetical protein
MKPLEYLEIFGGDEPSGLQPVQVPRLSTDDELFSYLPAGRTADAFIAQLLDDAQTAEICGLDSEQVRKICDQPAPPAPRDFIKTVCADVVRTELRPLLQRALYIAENAQRWRTDLHRIVEKTRTDPALAKIRDSEHWQQLVEAGVNLVEGCVRDCA